MADNIFKIHRVNTLPTLGTNGDWYILKKDNRHEIYIVQPDGTLNFSKGITDVEQSKLTQISQDDISKLIDLEPQSVINQKIQEATSIAGAAPYPITSNILPQTPDTTDLPDRATATIQGQTGGSTFTQNGGSAITVAQGKARTITYNKSTNLWTAGLEFDSQIDISNKADIVNSEGLVARRPYVSTELTLTPSSTFNGFWDRTTGAPNSAVSRSGRIFAITPNSKTYKVSVSIQGTATSLASYYNSSGNYLGFQNPGSNNATADIYTDFLISPPPGATEVRIPGLASNPAILKEITTSFEDFSLSGGSIKTTQELDNNLNQLTSIVENKPDEINSQEQKIARISIEYSYQNLIGNPESINGYYGYQTNYNPSSPVTASASWRSKRFDVTNLSSNEKQNLVASSIVRGTVTALVVYWNSSNIAIGYEFRGTSSTVSTVYTRQVLNHEQLDNVAYIGMSIYGNNVDLAKLEIRLGSYPDLATKSQIDTIKGETSQKVIAESGDSITANIISGWTVRFNELAQPLSSYNNAIGSSRWSKRTTTIAGQTITTQNFNDPNFAGFSTGSGANTDPIEEQKRNNNCAVVHIQKYISEVSLGNTPIPDVFIFAYGTNPDVSIGNLETALNGKTIDQDNTFTMANAMRWCVQEIRFQYPNCKVFISLPIQAASTSKNTLLKDTKIPLMKGIAEALSVPIIDCFGECGITEKFEVENAPGRYLSDGLHPNVNGGRLQGEYIYRKVIQHLSL